MLNFFLNNYFDLLYRVKLVGGIIKRKIVINQKYLFYGEDKQLIMP
jgi:hypothetical protein